MHICLPLRAETDPLDAQNAGSVKQKPYLTYLRNQTYQVPAYHRLR